MNDLLGSCQLSELTDEANASAKDEKTVQATGVHILIGFIPGNDSSVPLHSSKTSFSLND